jgi:archaeosortase A (PGF-CTERM-specific)
MQEIFVLISFIAFFLFLFPTDFRKYFAIAGWISVIGILFAKFPEYIIGNNFMYPVAAFLGIPFLIIIIPKLLEENEYSLILSRMAGIAYVIFAPFMLIPVLADWLIAVNVDLLAWMFSGIGFPYELVEWNMFRADLYRVEIILACTGIQGMAIMLGVALAIPSSVKQQVLSFFIVVPSIFVLNLLRNTFIIMAYGGQWFPYLPEIASNGQIGYESFFWAHNFVAEIGALFAFIAIAFMLYRINPLLGEVMAGIVDLFVKKIRGWSGKDR